MENGWAVDESSSTFQLPNYFLLSFQASAHLHTHLSVHPSIHPSVFCPSGQQCLLKTHGDSTSSSTYRERLVY